MTVTPEPDKTQSPTENSIRIAAVIIARNEEKRIEDCLRSLAWADEIVVLDSFSEDRTVEISRKYTDKVFQRKFDNFSKQRNHALDLGTCPWVLFVDADERVTEKLANEVRAVVNSTLGVASSSEPRPSAYWVPRHNLIWGKWIRHAGWYPDYQLRLLRIAAARYDEGREVHEVAEIDGTSGYLQQPLIHYNYDTVRLFLTKQEAYSSFEARLMLGKGIKPRARNYFGAPAREFFYRYITLEGYKDGGHGLALSSLLAWYKLKAYVKLSRMLSQS